MRQTLSRGVCAAAAATGILSLYGGTAVADTSATGAAGDSSGVLSGNTVQVPAEVPVNVCGNTVGVLAAMNGASGTSCVNASDESEEQLPPSSPGDCTDDCRPTPPVTDTPTPQPPRTGKPPRPVSPPSQTDRTPPTTVEQPGKQPQLAETGGKALLAASAASAALIAGGTVLYRRSRAVSPR
ncbi:MULTISPECIES: chaplin [Streptomyces]|uniref:Chaplin domain-containing protein n=2 Tax=Streptomyces TaxID=1883 RepID=A0ABN1T3R4_9ACTN|nr:MULTISPECIES: chaplin [unclassified Streptomyces]MDN5384711.1 chaplin [Streptomyces sp. LB8]